MHKNYLFIFVLCLIIHQSHQFGLIFGQNSIFNSKPKASNPIDDIHNEIWCKHKPPVIDEVVNVFRSILKPECEKTESKPIIEGRTDNNAKPAKIVEPKEEEEENISNDLNEACGKQIAHKRIIGGQEALLGQFPWMVSIFKQHNHKFLCGASLISNNLVLTAAHCMKQYGSNLPANDLILYFGHNNIDVQKEDSVVSRTVKKIIVHPDYQTKEDSFDADIAIIILNEPITYSRRIIPICLWNNSSKIEELVSQYGTTVGWGRNNPDGSHSSTLLNVALPIVSENDCLRSDPSFVFMTSNRTFCAGNSDYSGPCTGDSGGPFSILRRGRHYLRGVVSAGILDFDKNVCDATKFTVFTDIVPFLPWIIEHWYD